MRPGNKNLVAVVDYARMLLFLADKGDMQREDDSCGVLYGVLRDSAYRVKDAAEREIESHKRKGKWDAGDECDESPNASTERSDPGRQATNALGRHGPSGH